ncbi:helix-turn-helix transcriptional regulator [Sporolactobacillus sp. Y61]|jgi:predicted transcriptional regulator|uniref:Helix-turn-helix transcriptional regulator n=1 Tax=Sporolactobacillus sp. Y61 TaxID=3160863 RepID=A0AAU8IE98_9BACL|nr:helix-turn-helix transcriptional regulator [Sporolactobacillus sp. THM19-2]RYL90409.1 transcriptional regulator [Sporolactobacillus sp. THM19-2]
MELNERQKKIIEIVKKSAPVTGESIAEQLNIARATLRPDLALLTMAGFLDARPRVGYFYTGQTLHSLFSEQLAKLKVIDFLSFPAVIKEDASAYQAVCDMFTEDVGSLFVIDENGYLTGVTSRKDLLRTAIGTQDMNQVPVSMIMSRMPNIVCCHEQDSVIDVAEMLISRQVDAVPVVRDHEHGLEVIGRMTKTNITRAFVKLAKGTVE